MSELKPQRPCVLSSSPAALLADRMRLARGAYRELLVYSLAELARLDPSTIGAASVGTATAGADPTRGLKEAVRLLSAALHALEDAAAATQPSPGEPQ